MTAVISPLSAWAATLLRNARTRAESSAASLLGAVATVDSAEVVFEVDARSARRGRLGESLTLSLLCLSLSGCAAEHGSIGAVLAQRSDRTLVVREVPEGLAAAKAGVTVGDELLLIDGRDVRALSPEQVHRALAGEVGESVKLTLIRAERIVRVSLLRSPAPRAKQPRTE